MHIINEIIRQYIVTITQSKTAFVTGILLLKLNIRYDNIEIIAVGMNITGKEFSSIFLKFKLVFLINI